MCVGVSHEYKWNEKWVGVKRKQGDVAAWGGAQRVAWGGAHRVAWGGAHKVGGKLISR